MLQDSRGKTRGVKRVAILPGGDPRVGAFEVQATAVAASNIGNHLIIFNARASEQLDLTSFCVFGHNMAASGSRTQSDIAITILIN
jgi:hypothetical protein